ncbi:hypothetical protein AMS68_000241 [Peltaster fructicola]|uniref:Uncharacterized protein n=1 Tax=Peltaster fructicola TaxID=286661 RepID=A0A6H0XJ33_9PEZI|nr:hypothetical protein AMS68_000241 [Peltaster fructicola]
MSTILSIIYAVSTFNVLVHALDGIVTPSNVVADQEFDVSFVPGASDSQDQFRVYLSAAAVGQNGPLCYLQNLTTLTSPFKATIPAQAGPDGVDYSIGVADITTGQGATFGNKFNFTGGTGTPSDYETHLNGAPFWDADKLPCTSMHCARQCAQANYPGDLTDDTAYDNMKTCIEKCPGVAMDTNATAPANGASGNNIPVALVTLGPSMILTAYETVITSGSMVVTQAIVGNKTLTLGSAPAVVSSAAISLANSGLIVAGSSLVPFTTAAPNSTSTTAPASTTAAAATTSSSAAAYSTEPQIIFAGCIAAAMAVW